MNDTVKRLMSLADEYRNAGPNRVGQCAKALEAELARLFTPLSDEQIKQSVGVGEEYWATSKIFIKAIFQAAEQAHEITGGAE